MSENQTIQATAMQIFLRGFSGLTLGLLARIRVTGRENLPERGPMIVVANHRSTIDPVLLSLVLPAGARFVSPGDFELLFPANLFVKWNHTIRVRRTLEFERAPLKEMTDHLRKGGILALFPEGGTWEKPLMEAKEGAAYLSLMSGAPILPVGLGNTYQSWNKVARLGRPLLTVNIGKPLPPIQAERADRAAALTAGTQAIMERIHDLLPNADKAWYAAQTGLKFDLLVEYWKDGRKISAELPGGGALAEFMLKPNLNSPFARNAGLPIDPLVHHSTAYLPASVRLAAEKMQMALADAYRDYFEYRLGEAKGKHIREALAALLQLSETPGLERIMLTPSSQKH